MKSSDNAAIAALVGAILCLFGLPLILTVWHVYPSWQGVPPPHIEDALFYYARMRDAAEGYFLFGNPAYSGYQDSFSGSFSISEWLAAWPFALTGSWAFTIIWNNIFWPFVAAIATFFFFRTLEVGRWTSVIGSLAVISQMILLFERPVVMQVPYAVFMIFMLAFVLWVKQPSRLHATLLGIVAALGAAVWVFLGGMIAITLMLTFVFYCAVRNWTRVQNLILAGVLSLVLVSPIVFFQIAVANSSDYTDMLQRFGLVLSHIPAADAWYFGRWMVVGCAIAGLSWFFQRHRLSKGEQDSMVMFILLSLGTLLAIASPIFLGKDLNNASHTGRFAFPLLAATVVYALHYWFWTSRWKSLSRVSLAILGLCLAFSSVGIFLNVVKRNLPYVPSSSAIAEVQSYAAPLRFLETYSVEPAVVWANTTASQYIPVVTQHSVLFVSYGGYYLISDDEIEARYVASLYPQPPSVSFLQEQAPEYDLGRVSYMAQVLERPRGLCKVTGGVLFSGACNLDASYVALRGDDFFEHLSALYAEMVASDINTTLDRFDVQYILRDREQDQSLDPSSIRGKEIYDDGRFIIYEREVSELFSS